MKHLGKEFLVGCLVLLAVAAAIAFAWLMGSIGPFKGQARFTILYGFAGGVEVGSPVRVSGVKVGRVERISFLPDSGPDQATLAIVIGVEEAALPSVREDSRFYVNMAGIIGERYIEISPGSAGSPRLVSGATVRGVDPPRIDQLLSQGYGVFGRIQDFLDRNEKTLQEFLTELESVVSDLNKGLKGANRKQLFNLIENLNEITREMKGVVKGLNGERAKALFDRVETLVERAEEIDRAALKKFLQDEGIRARIF